MRIVIHQTMAGPDGVAYPGDIVDLPADQAKALIAARQAEAVGAYQSRQQRMETATAGAEETAALR